jgi:magnesium chelatase family protein
MSEISGPLLDRIDIHFEVPAVKYAELSSKKSGEPSSAVRTGFKKARGIQRKRFNGRKPFSKTQTCHGVISSHLTADGQSKEIRQFCQADNAREDLLKWGIKDLDSAPVSTIRSYRELD